MQAQVNEADWKLFRKMLPEWQEAHMNKLNQDYAAILAGSGTAADKFWELERRISADKEHVGVVARMSRSNMYHNIFGLLTDGTITMDDLKGFSDDLRERVAFVTREQ